MVSLPNANAEAAPSQEAAPPAVTIGNLLYSLSQLMLRTGRDYPIAPAATSALESTVSIEAANNSARANHVDGANAANTSNCTLPNADAADNSTSTARVEEHVSDADLSLGAPSDPVIDGDVDTTESDTSSVSADDVNEAIIQPDIDDPNVRWYAVTAGFRVGVFSHWNVVAPLVVGAKGACFTRFSNRAEARAAFLDAVARGAVHVVPSPRARYPDFDINGYKPSNGHGRSGGSGGAGGAGGIDGGNATVV